MTLEVSYAFKTEGHDPWGGYCERALNWQEEPFDPYGWMAKAAPKSAKAEPKH